MTDQNTRTPEAIASVIKAYDVRGVVGDGIDADLVRDIGAAFGLLMRNEGASTVVVGHDMRDSSPGLSAAFAEGVNSQGLDTVSLGLTSTDELYFASGTADCPGAMFTASHNPAKYNGIKLCRSGARPVGQETGLAEISAMLVDGVPAYDGAAGTGTEKDVLADYAAFLHGLVDLDIRPLTVAVDAGNGMGGLTVPAVLGEDSGVPVTVKPLYFELDGTFPNHEANPLAPENIVDLQKFTVEQGADLGVAFDGDADRCFIVDELGEPVPPSAICGIIAERYLADNPGATIIHNLITSKAVAEIVRENGGTPVRTRVGHSFIKAVMAEESGVFGGEHSAHYYFKDFFNADTGMLAAMHVLAALGEGEQPLSELGAAYSPYVPSGEINSELEDKAGAITRVAEYFGDTVEVSDMDGTTFEHKTEGWWANLRPSNTEPFLRLNLEAPDQATMERVRDQILKIVREG